MNNLLNNEIKHVSFDMWNTLITANPAFGKARHQLISDILGVDPAAAKAAYTATKVFLDRTAELTGFGTSSVNATRLMISQMRADESQAEVVLDAVNQLALEHPPTLVDGIAQVLNRLRELGITTSILSNTNFIRGKTLRSILDHELGVNAFDFQLYSDECLMAKPSSAFFVRTRQVAAGLHREITAEEFLHVGDNMITDVQGAAYCGFQTLTVFNPEDTIIKLTRAFN